MLFLKSMLLVLILAGNTFAEDSLPNVVIILTDDQGWADVGYNNPKVYSPNIDKLARAGATFSKHYVMPQCTPTRVALMTGRYPSRFGPAALQASNNPSFPLGTPTIAKMFQDSGYETFLCGKWHLGSSFEHGPLKFGFDHSYGSLAGAVGMYDHRYRTGKFQNTWHRDDQLIDGHENGTHATQLVADEAIRIIKTKRKNPFFLYVPFHSVHTPLDERGKFTDRPTQLDPANSKRWLNEAEIKWFNDPKGLIQSEKDPEKRLFLAAVHHLDDAVGRIVAAIDESGQRENTLILFSSDNGPQVSWKGNAYPDDLQLTDFNQPHPMRGKKVDVWEGGIHVPAFANWPGKIEPKVIEDTVHIVDWFPTLAFQVSYVPEKSIDWDGTNIWSTIFKDQPVPKRNLFWSWGSRTNRWAVRQGDWKIVKYGKSPPETPEDWSVFNLGDDPKEEKDLVAEKEEVANVLHHYFLQNRIKDHDYKASPTKLPPTMPGESLAIKMYARSTTGKDRLCLRTKTQGKPDRNSPLSWNNIQVSRYHSLAIEERQGAKRKWTPTAVMDNRLLAQFGRNASISAIHHFDSETKIGIVRVTFAKPIKRGAVAAYQWIELDVANSKIERIISDKYALDDDFSPPRGRVVVIPN